MKFYKGMLPSHVSQGFHKDHEGADIVSTYGTPLCAIEDCEVLGTTRESLTHDNKDLERGYGIRLKGKEHEYLYWHTLPIFPVSQGERVKQGQIIAYMGNAGNVRVNGKYVPLDERVSTHKGTHLHIEAFKNGVRVDPLPLVDWSLEPQWTKTDFILAMVKVLGKISRII